MSDPRFCTSCTAELRRAAFKIKTEREEQGLKPEKFIITIWEHAGIASTFLSSFTDLLARLQGLEKERDLAIAEKEFIEKLAATHEDRVVKAIEAMQEMLREGRYTSPMWGER